MTQPSNKILIVECNSALAASIVHVLNMDMGMTAEATAPPVTLMLVPAGPRVEGRDGRGWNNPDPQSLIRFFQENGLDIPIDVEHSTQLKAPKGEPAPAVAWGKSLEVRPDGSIWGTFDWNDSGSALVMGRQYRYYSPAYIIDSKTMNIVGIKSVGLTNTPNLAVPALNHMQEKGDTMNLVALLAAVGLTSTATFEDALNSITKMKGDLTVALNSAASPPLDKFVPKADYELVLNRATSAEGKLSAQEKTTLETAINSAIAAALKAGKITPATQQYHVDQCHQEGGLDRFKAFVAAAPVTAGDSNLDKKAPGATDTVLNAEELKVCDMMGLNVEEYKKANNIA